MNRPISEIYKTNFNLYEQKQKNQQQNSQETSNFQKMLNEEINKLKENDKKTSNEELTDDMTLEDILIAKGFGLKKNNINIIESEER